MRWIEEKCDVIGCQKHGFPTWIGKVYATKRLCDEHHRMVSEIVGGHPISKREEFQLRKMFEYTPIEGIPESEPLPLEVKE